MRSALFAFDTPSATLFGSFALSLSLSLCLREPKHPTRPTGCSVEGEQSRGLSGAAAQHERVSKGGTVALVVSRSLIACASQTTATKPCHRADTSHFAS
mmetsp:Transcript_10056/g.27564  ORF Transcript_10056/g.27564 Transcript_10056/m.27564 type:complete len:99 (+) Transcript_10056:289-585(+)